MLKPSVVEHPISRFPHLSISPSPHFPISPFPHLTISPFPLPPLVLLFQDIGGVEIEGGSRARVRPAKFGVTAVADGQDREPAVDRQVDEHCDAQQAVRNQIAAEPVEHGADERADHDDGEADLGIEVLARVEIAALTDRTDVDGIVVTKFRADGERNLAAASSAADGGGPVNGINRQAGIA